MTTKYRVVLHNIIVVAKDFDFMTSAILWGVDRYGARGIFDWHAEAYCEDGE